MGSDGSPMCTSLQGLRKKRLDEKIVKKIPFMLLCCMNIEYNLCHNILQTMLDLQALKLGFRQQSWLTCWVQLLTLDHNWKFWAKNCFLVLSKPWNSIRIRKAMFFSRKLLKVMSLFTYIFFQFRFEKVNTKILIWSKLSWKCHTWRYKLS